MANTTFNPSDNVGNTLSGGNLTVTSTNTQGGTRSVAKQTAGKFYWEFVCTTWSPFGILVGVANPSAALSTVAGTMTGACAITGASGSIYVNSTTSVATLGSRANGDVIGVALDLGANLIWFRVAPSGNWNGSGTANPATGAGGISISSITGAGLHAVTFINAGLGGLVITANFGDSAFSGAVPSGFTSGFPAAATSAQATLVALEEWSNPQPPARLTQVAVEEWGSLGVVAGRAVMSQVALEQWATFAARPPIDLAGNLGGVSSYGRRSYGVRHYCREDAFAPILSAALTVSVGDAFAGNLAPVVSLGGSLGIVRGIGGSLTPVVTFAADLVTIGFRDFAGGIVPSVALGASLAVDVSFTVLEGGLTPIVSLGASSMISGPLWAASESCPAAPWTDTEPCPPPAWILSEPCAPVTWTPARTCNG